MLGIQYIKTEIKVDSYKIGKKVNYNGGVAKITALNNDGTATLNWHKPPSDSFSNKKGSFAGTLPSLKTKSTVQEITNRGEDFTSENFSTETIESYEVKSGHEDSDYVIERQYELYNKEGFPNELGIEESRIRLHKMLIQDHTFVQDPDDIPGGCKTCWDSIQISITE
jgi:hypothetical protein